MADVIKKATREAFGEGLVALGAEMPNLVVLDADLAAATKTGMFKKAYPDRFFDCGIAEQNMIGVAAGLAAAGKVPVASSFAMFASGRAYEQIRNSVGYPHLNVKIGATHAGISVGEDGATHQCCEDLALMRTIPGMTVLNPADYVEAGQVVRAAVKMEGPVYMRFGRLAIPTIFDSTYRFEIGKGVQLTEGTDVTLIATGLLAAPILSRLVDEARETWHNLLVEVVPIKNRFFGETITVAGLLTGRDLMEQLRGREADILLLPRDMLRREGDCFLDDATPDEVAQALSMRVEMLPVDGADLLEALFW